MHEVVGRRERRFCIVDGVESEWTQQTCCLRLSATARAALRLETEMRRQLPARQLQTEPLRVAVLGLRDECHGSRGIEQDDIAGSDIYDAVVLNDCRSAR